MSNSTNISAGTEKVAGSVLSRMMIVACVSLILLVVGGIFGAGLIFWLVCFAAGGVTGCVAVRARYLLIVIGSLALLKLLALFSVFPYSRSPLQTMDAVLGAALFAIAHLYFRTQRKSA